MQEVHDVRAADDLLIERRGTRLAHGLKAIEGDHREDVNELPIPIRMLRQALAQPRQGRR